MHDSQYFTVFIIDFITENSRAEGVYYCLVPINEKVLISFFTAQSLKTDLTSYVCFQFCKVPRLLIMENTVATFCNVNYLHPFSIQMRTNMQYFASSKTL